MRSPASHGRDVEEWASPVMRGTLPLCGRAMTMMVRAFFTDLLVPPPAPSLQPHPPHGSAMPTVSFENLLACLELVEKEPVYHTGPNPPLDYQRVFGGQILAQGLLAPTRTAGEGKQVKSLAHLFPREV